MSRLSKRSIRKGDLDLTSDYAASAVRRSRLQFVEQWLEMRPKFSP